MDYKNSHLKYLLLVPVVILLFYTFTNLTESPATWMDEGIIVQTARNYSVSGFSGLRVDPENVVSAGYVTTSYPVTMPIATVFNIFGISLFNARMVMAIFILILVFFVYKNNKKYLENDYYLLALSLILLVSFPPLYGHGKNVLGEVPGMALLFISVYLFDKLISNHDDKDISKYKQYSLLFLSSLFFGLVFVTKPIFIILIPAIFITFFIKNRSNLLSLFDRKNVSLYVMSLIAFFIPVLFWIKFQFHGEGLAYMLSIYVNPQSNSLESNIIINIKRFFTESQPIYTLLLMVIWTIAIIKNKFNKIKIGSTQLFLYIFSLLILVAYIRTTGYYRYFFIAEFIALTFFISNLKCLFKNKIIIYFIAIPLILYQIYNLNYSSWVSKSIDNSQSEDLQLLLSNISDKNEIFVYQAPEIVTFIKGENYSQYLQITSSIQVGSTSLTRLAEKKPELIVTNSMYNDVVYKIVGDAYEGYASIGKYSFIRKKH